jgi:two-component system, chemotaxis family, chemotaxis protein CheY
MKALIVDDSRAARMLIKRIVVALGFEITEAGHGEEALERLLECDGDVDLMLVDWNMPVMDGITLVRRVREVRAYADISILMVSSESDPRQIGRALMVGADDYLVKPIDEPMLREKLEMIGVLEGAR